MTTLGPAGTLPPKEKAKFRTVVKLYENKQYRQALRTADDILKSFPNHGETLSMKGLTLHYMGRPEEAQPFVERGVRADFKSSVCWHVWGLLLRAQKNYVKAIACYKQALSIDKENQQIMRDMHLLQMQTRDLDGLVDTARKLLLLKPGMRGLWLSLVMSYQLQGKPDIAKSVLDQFLNDPVLHDSSPPQGWAARSEESETILYRASLLVEAGEHAEAFKFLTSKAASVMDKKELHEFLAQTALHTNKPGDAERNYRQLLAINPENHAYYYGLATSKSLMPPVGGHSSEEQRRGLLEMYDQLTGIYPRAQAVGRLALDAATGDDFVRRFTAFVLPWIRKGVPSLFRSLLSLYADAAKVRLIEVTVLSWEKSLEMHKVFPNAQSGSEQEAPTTLLWTWVLLAQHFDRLRQWPRALAYLKRAREHTPTVIDLILFEARLHKHAGDDKRCAELFDEARKLDLADRYLNTKCTKYLLRANEVQSADDVISLFTKEGDTSQSNLFDMQASWYEQECGDSHFRMGGRTTDSAADRKINYGKALKKYHDINKHFEDIYEDQLEFHGYCIRKMTIRSYIEMHSMENRLYGHRAFFRAASAIVRTYLELHDNALDKASDSDDPELAGLSPSSRRKLLGKRKKADKQKAEAAAALLVQQNAAAAAAAKGKKGPQKAPPPVDADPNGEKFVNVPDKLAPATEFLRRMQLHCSDRIESHLLAFEVYIRKSKFLLCLQALKRSVRLSPLHPEVHKQTIRFFLALEKATLHATVRQVVDEERATLLRGAADVAAYNAQYLKENSASLPHRAAAAEMMLELNTSPEAKAEALRLLSDLSCPDGSASHLKEAIASHKFMTKVGDLTAANKFAAEAAKIFTLSTYFNQALAASSATVPSSKAV